MSTATHMVPVIASVSTTEPTTQKKLVWFYAEVVNCFLSKFANDKSMTKMGSTTMRYPNLAIITPMQHTDNLYPKSCKASNFYDVLTLNGIFIE